MIRHHRPLATLLAIALIGSSAAAQIQIRGGIQILPNGRVVTTTEDSERAGDGQLFVENRRVSNALRSAAVELDAIKSLEGEPRLQRLQRTISALQQILDLEEDFWYATNETRTLFRSAKAEAALLVEGLPQDGSDLYENEFAPVAKAALSKAVASNDVTGIEEVVRRYFNTPAGVEAAYRLGNLHLDRAEALAAALVFERVRGSGTQAFEPMLSLRTAVAWGRAGLPEKSVETLEDFRKNFNGRGIKVGGREVPLFQNRAEALPWLVKVLGAQPAFREIGREEWTVFRGNPARTASTRPASPLWREKWRYATIEDPRADNPKLLVDIVGELRKMEKAYRERGLLVTPAMHPLVVEDAVVFRTMHNVRALAVEDGRTRWRSEAWDRSYDEFLENGINVAQPTNVNGRRIVVPNQSGIAVTPAQKYLTQRAWKDLAAGTLSSDGRLVFSVEELGFLNGYTNVPTGIIVPGATGTARANNKLMSVELSTGMLKWEIGGPPGEDNLPLDGSFFLGPPLPLGGRLYTIVERKGEIQLVMIENLESTDESGLTDYEPRVRWTQSLVAPQQDVNLSPLRKMAGLSPSYADGMMICPTAAGAIVAVDLSRRQLAWGYPYKTTTSPAVGNPFIRRMPQVTSTGNDDEDRWLDSSPMIADGRVIVTPRDSTKLHCIDLTSGQPAWEPQSRGDGLYVAGFHAGNVIIVGRSQVRAVKLSDGSDAWAGPIPISMPSGRGVQAGSLYHLPLQEGAIATLDLESGRLLAKSVSQSGRVAGNLVAAGGMILSLAPDQVIAFEPLADVESRIDERLKASPDSAEALAERGELLLHWGREKEAVADLKKAIDAGAGKPTRELYVNTLLEGLRLDFDAYRDEVDAALPLIEEVGRKRAYLRLHALGLERSGNLENAFDEYVKLSGLTSGKPTLERTGGHVSVRSDRWIRPRLARLIAEAPKDRSAAMQKTLEAELEAARESKDPARLRRLAVAFGRLSLGDSVRRALVEKLDPEKNALERSLVLEQLRRSENASMAGFATAELARMAIEAEPPRAEDAVVWFDELEQRFGDVKCLGERTGSQLVTEWNALGIVQALPAKQHPWPSSSMKVSSKSTNSGVVQEWPVPVVGSPGPYWAGWRFMLDNPRQRLIARDPSGRTRWTVDIRSTTTNSINVYGNFVRAQGKLLACALGSHFAVIDPLTDPARPKVLWKKSLLEPGDPVVNARNVVGPAPGVMRMIITDRYGRPLGTVGAVTPDTVYYQVGTRMYAAEALTGDVLWERRNVPRGCLVRADGETVLLVEEAGNGATLVSADDGRTIGTRRVPEKGERLVFEGRHVLAFAKGAKAGLVLQDVIAEKADWTLACNAQSKLSIVESEDVAVYEPSGRFRIVRIRDGKVLVDTKLEKADGLLGMSVVRTEDRYILLPNQPVKQQAGVGRIFVGGVGFNSQIVNGTVVAFARENGETLWSTKVEHQSLPTGQSPGVPVLIFSSRNHVQINRVGGRAVTNRYALLMLDTRNGRVLLNERGQRPAVPYKLDVTPDQGRMRYSFYQRSVEVTFEKEATPPVPTKKP